MFIKKYGENENLNNNYFIHKAIAKKQYNNMILRYPILTIRNVELYLTTIRKINKKRSKIKMLALPSVSRPIQVPPP